MDKFETNIKLDQLKKAIDEKKADIAASIADEIEWKKEKEVQTLVLGADAYELNHDYENAKELLLMAYERTHMGKNLAFRLAVICTKIKQFDEADDFYQDFIEMAPRDTNRYILQYTIAKAKGMPVGYLVGILEEYVDVDMEEKWMYELAALYDEAGDVEKCVELCDEMSLWFSHGKYVKRALDLKKKYKPLTKSQEENYNYVEEEVVVEENTSETAANTEQEADKALETMDTAEPSTEKTEEAEALEDAVPEQEAEPIDEHSTDSDANPINVGETPAVALGAIDIISGLAEEAQRKIDEKFEEMLPEVNETATAVFEPVKKSQTDLEDTKKGNTIPFTTLKTEEFKAKALEEEKANKPVDFEDIDNNEVLEDPIMEAVLASEKLAEESVADTVQIPGEINIEDIHVKSFEGDGSDTIDLQAVIARNIREIMNSDEQMKEIKIENEKPDDKITMTLDPMFKYEENGQIGFDIPEPKKAEKEITGQLSIEEVLRNLEDRGILKADTVNKTVETMDISAQKVDKAAKEAAKAAEEALMNTTIVEELDAKDLADESEMEDVKAALESYADDAINGFVFTEEIDSDAIAQVLSDTAPIPLAEIELEDSKPETMQIDTMNIDPVSPVEVVDESGVPELEEAVLENPELEETNAEENSEAVLESDVTEESEATEDNEEVAENTEEVAADEIAENDEVVSDDVEEEVAEEVAGETTEDEADDVADETAEAVEDETAEDVTGEIGEVFTDELEEAAEKEADLEVKPRKNKKLDEVMLHTKDLKAEVEAVFEKIEAEKKAEQEALAGSGSDNEIETMNTDGDNNSSEETKATATVEDEMPEDDVTKVIPDISKALEEMKSDEDEETVKTDNTPTSLADTLPEKVELKNDVPFLDLTMDAPVKKLHTGIAPMTKPSPANTASLKELFANIDKATKEDMEENSKEDKGGDKLSSEKVKDNNDLPEVKKKTNTNITQTLSLDLDKIVVTDAEMMPFESFKSVNGLEQKIKDTITSLAASYCGLGHSRTGNIMILGDDKSGKTTMAIELIKIINKKRGRHGRRIAKVDAAVLNTRGIRSSMKKLVGSDLIVENAQHLRRSVLTEFVSVGQYFTDDMIMVFEGETSALKTMRSENMDIAKMFDNVLVIKEYDVKEWVAYAKKFAATRNYMVDEMGTLALYKAIDDFYSKHQGIDQADVENIVSRAIKKANSKVTRKLTNLFSGKNDETGMDILREADFK